MSELDQFTSMLWHLVNYYGVNERAKEDLFQEAQIAAFTAIAKYDATKKASMRTFVYRCVKAKLVDIQRDAMAQKRTAQIVPLEDVMSELEGTAYNTIEDVEFNLTMKALLTHAEYRVYFLCFVEDKTLRDISSEMKCSLRRAHQCYQSILRKFALLEESHTRLLTRRGLQEKWLDVSLA